jgi:hypothetical protein
VAGPVLAEELLVNGDFATNTAPWMSSENFLTIDFDTRDRDDAVDSGSMILENNGQFLDTDAFAFQCAQVASSRFYDLRGSVFIPSIPMGGLQGGTADLSVFWYASEDCSGGALGLDQTVSVTSEDVWMDLQRLGLLSPPGSASAEVRANSSKNQAGGPVVGILFDELSLLPEPSRVLLDAVGLATVIGLAWRRRPRAPSPEGL